jgi:hypothetical protein
MNGCHIFFGWEVYFCTVVDFGVQMPMVACGVVVFISLYTVPTPKASA